MRDQFAVPARGGPGLAVFQAADHMIGKAAPVRRAARNHAVFALDPRAQLPGAAAADLQPVRMRAHAQIRNAADERRQKTAAQPVALGNARKILLRKRAGVLLHLAQKHQNHLLILRRALTAVVFKGFFHTPVVHASSSTQTDVEAMVNHLTRRYSFPAEKEKTAGLGCRGGE